MALLGVGGSAGAQQAAQKAAAAALSNLATSTANRVLIAQAGAIEPLVSLVRSGSTRVQVLRTLV